jgi:low temperature requirement protein LtrA
VSVAGDSTYLAAEYGLLLVTVGIMFARGARQPAADRQFARRMASVCGASAALFFVATLLTESQRLALAVVGLAVAVGPSVVLLHRTPPFSAEEERHLVERMGAFTLIVCGESFVEVALSVSGSSLDRVDIVSLIFEFVLVFAIFTSYFDDIPAAGINQRLFGWWASLHLVAQICIAGTAVGASKLVDLSTGHRLPDIEILKLTLPLGLLFVALAGLGASTRRRPMHVLVVTRLGTAGVVAVVGVIAWWVPRIHMVEALPMLTAVVIVHAGLVVRELRRTEVVVVGRRHRVG